MQRTQITGLQVRMPLSCQNTRTHRRTAPIAGLRGDRAGRTTYSRIYLPADGSANVSFVADDNSRQPEIYLSLQLHGGIGHVSVHARSQAARETCSGALGFDVRAALSPRDSAITPPTIAAAPAIRCQPPRSA